MKGLLRERKVDLLVDPDLKQNYDQKEVEELIQVKILNAMRLLVFYIFTAGTMLAQD